MTALSHQDRAGLAARGALLVAAWAIWDLVKHAQDGVARRTDPVFPSAGCRLDVFPASAGHSWDRTRELCPVEVLVGPTLRGVPRCRRQRTLAGGPYCLSSVSTVRSVLQALIDCDRSSRTGGTLGYMPSEMATEQLVARYVRSWQEGDLPALRACLGDEIR